MDRQRMSLRIGNMYYSFQSSEDPEYMREIARKADELFQLFKANYPGMNDLSVAVLALVNAVDACEKIKAGGNAVEIEQAQLQEKLDESKAECLRIRENLWEMKKELLYYRNLCEIYEERLAEFSARGQSIPAKPTRKEKIRPLDAMQRSLLDEE